MTEGDTQLQNARFSTFTEVGTSYHEICSSDLVQVVVGGLFTSEDEFLVQALRDFVMPPETSPS